jgi:hypothetical protein
MSLFTEDLKFYTFPKSTESLVFHVKHNSAAIRMSYINRQGTSVSYQLLLRYGRTQILPRDGNIDESSRIRIDILNPETSLSDQKSQSFMRIVDADEKYKQYVMHVHDPSAHPYASVFYEHAIYTLNDVTNYE